MAQLPPLTRFDNGYISFFDRAITFDDNGVPTTTREMVSPKMPCRMQATTYQTKGESEQIKYTDKAYTIYLPKIENIDQRYCTLYDTKGNSIGEFEIQRVDKLTLVKRTSISAKIVAPYQATILVTEKREAVITNNGAYIRV